MIVVLIRTVVLYAVVTIAIRLMGKRQIGDMQPNELVITLLISEIAAIPLQDSSQPLWNGIAAIFMLVILEICLSVLALKSFRIRKWMSGTSVVLIQNGILDQQALRKVRMTVLDLIELLRGEQIFEISDIAFAVLEVNGSLSVVKKNDAREIEIRDLKDPKSREIPAGLPLPVISDGKAVRDSLSALGVSEKQLRAKVAPKQISDIFLMTLDGFGNQTVIEKEAAA